ncbi:MAG: cytochrome c [Lysobacterales bacterium]|nr:MAG: cytochrome c [Xanthomonadales bacterium]
MRTFTRTIVTIGSAIALTAGSALSVSADEGDAIKYRKSVMQVNSGNIGGAVAIIKGKVPYKDDLVVFAEGLNSNAMLVPNAFKQKTTGGETQAKPEIWEDAADFQQKIKDFQAATADFLAAAKAGGPEAAGAKLGAVGDSCKGCHEKYRTKKS